MKQKFGSIVIMLAVLLIIQSTFLQARSVFRPIKLSWMPAVQVRYTDDKKIYEHADIHYGPTIFSIFDKNHFDEHLIPQSAIHYRYKPELSVSGQLLGNLVDQLLEEILQGKKSFTHFIDLKSRDFNNRKHVGFRVFAFKNYPFIVKISIETPDSFTSPFSKGLEPHFFFYMGGGMNRHMSGLTRIRNLELLQQLIGNEVSFPRKWFYLPKKARWLEITGINLGPDGNLKMTIPATYAIIVDKIAPSRSLSIFNENDCQKALLTSEKAGGHLDAHIKNFMIERIELTKGSPVERYVVIDTEHFPSVVGLENVPPMKSYYAWYQYLIQRMVKVTFWTSKKERRDIIQGKHQPIPLTFKK